MLSAVLAVLLLQEAPAIPPFDWNIFVTRLVEVLVPVVTTLVIWWARKLLENIPRAAIPIIAVVLGTAFDWLTAYISGGVFNPAVGALLGAFAVWLHQFISILAEFGMASRKETGAKKSGY